ncbi:hypothetical protein L6452_35563 [Arctium lappa]|uniref:Uncharacterized protein n=1 Tax=Arctium lappa TaxID=4217 RepID=A0ACB8Y613_ARCLA|nr:hypothetical protein L6452_35563 [Arctium lappa]
MWLLATIYVQLLVEDLMFVQQHFSSLLVIYSEVFVKQSYDTYGLISCCIYNRPVRETRILLPYPVSYLIFQRRKRSLQQFGSRVYAEQVLVVTRRFF